MAITGIDTIEGKQIIAAGAVSAKSADRAYNDENGNPITGYLTAVPEGYATTEDLTAYQLTADMTGYQVAGEYYSASNPSGFITGVDLSDYATTAELADKQDITGMTAYQPIGNYQTAGDYLTTADSANFYTTANESGFITGVDLTPYQLTADMTAYQPTGDYLTTADSANFYTTANESGFITGVDLTPYQTVEGMTAYATVESLTAKQDAGNYLSATDSANFLLTSDSGNFYPMTGNPSGFINELPAEEAVEFEEIDLTDYQPVSSMTAYANSADVTGTAQYGLTTAGWSEITGGGSVPEGVMVESGLEYDNTEISGYSGSAFKDVALTDVVTANSGVWGGSALPISAGPGIKFEIVDNTLVASTQGPILDEITIAGTWNGREVKQMLLTGTFSTNVNSDVIPVNSAYSACERKWIDPSNSFIFYGSSANILPSTWVLGATGRLGSLILLNGIVRARSNDTTQTNCTAFVTIKWCEN